MAKGRRQRPEIKRLGQEDLDRISVRVLSRSARERMLAGQVAGAKHADKRRKPPRHKKRPAEEE